MSGSFHQDASAAENEFSRNTTPFPEIGELSESEKAAPETIPPELAISSPSGNSTQSNSAILTAPESSSSGDSADPSFLPSEPRRDAELPHHNDDRRSTVNDGSFAARTTDPENQPPVHPLHQWSSYPGNHTPQSSTLSPRHYYRLDSPVTSPAEDVQARHHVPGAGQPIADILHDQQGSGQAGIRYHQGDQRDSSYSRRQESPDISLLSAQTSDTTAAAQTPSLTGESHTSPASQGKHATHPLPHRGRMPYTASFAATSSAAATFQIAQQQAQTPRILSESSTSPASQGEHATHPLPHRGQMPYTASSAASSSAAATFHIGQQQTPHTPFQRPVDVGLTGYDVSPYPSWSNQSGGSGLSSHPSSSWTQAQPPAQSQHWRSVDDEILIRSQHWPSTPGSAVPLSGTTTQLPASSARSGDDPRSTQGQNPAGAGSTQ